MTWQIAAIIFMLMATVSNLMRRWLAKDLIRHNRLINLIFFAVLYPTGIVYALTMPHNLAIGMQNLILLLVGSLIFPIINITTFRANKHLDAGAFTILDNLSRVITIGTAVLWLNEGFTGYQVIGATLIILSAVIVGVPRLHEHHLAIKSGLGWALIAVFLHGIAITYERYMLQQMDLGAYLIIGWGCQLAWMLLLARPKRHEIRQLRLSKKLNHVLIYAMTASVRAIGFITMLKLTSAAFASAIVSFLPIAVVIAGFVFLHERRMLLLRIASAATGTIGLLIITR